MARDRQDLSSTFEGPSMRVNDELLARGMLAAEEGRGRSDAEREAIKRELDGAFAESSDGIELSK